MVAYAAWWQGDFIDVRNHSHQGLALYNPDQHRAGIASYNQNPGIICGYLSRSPTGCLVTRLRRTQAMATRLGSREGTPTSVQHRYNAPVLSPTGSTASRARTRTDTRGRGDGGIAEHGLHRGGAVVPAAPRVGRRAAGRRARRPLRHPRGDGPPPGGGHRRGVAVVPGAIGRRTRRTADNSTEGLRALDEAQQWVQRNDERLYAAEVHRIKGELLLRQASPDPVRPNAVSTGPGDCPRPAGEVLGAARGYEPGPNCGCRTAGSTMPASCSHRSTTGSPKGSTPPICRTQRRS